MQRALIQYRLPRNYDLVNEALHKAGRTDLIGFDKHCLIRPRRDNKSFDHKPKKKATEVSKKRKPIRNIHKKKGGR